MTKRTTEQWLALFAEHQANGLTAEAFRREHKLCPKYFGLRRKQLTGTGRRGARAKQRRAPTALALTPVTVAPASRNAMAAVRIQLPNGIRVDVLAIDTFDAVAELCRQLELPA